MSSILKGEAAQVISRVMRGDLSPGGRCKVFRRDGTPATLHCMGVTSHVEAIHDDLVDDGLVNVDLTARIRSISFADKGPRSASRVSAVMLATTFFSLSLKAD